MTARTILAPAAYEDRYEILDFLAEGGMGSIYLGRKLGASGFEKEVVLKQLRPEYTEHPEFIELFLREAKLSATLDHANIVHTIDFVRAGHDYFIVMEYVRGGDLRVLLRRAKKRKRRLAPAAALYIAREVLAALVYAHGRKGRDGRPLGLIHRDVSPANILLSGAGEVKLTDFGIAKATTYRSAFFRVRGKVGYMSPEQARSQPLAPRSDVYSVAAILFELLTGEKLHVAAGLTTSADEMYARPVPAVSAKNPKLPAALDGVVWRGLAVDADARYQSAREMLEALQEIVELGGLGYDALSLARHLVDICGPVEEWRSGVVRAAEAPAAEATAGLPHDEPESESAELVWVEDEQALPRARVAAPDETGRFAGAELRPVEEFIADRVMPVAPGAARPRRRIAPLAISVVAAAAVGILAVALLRARPAPPPPSAPAPAPRPAAPPPPPIQVSVASEPAHARVLVDGRPRCLTPCTFAAVAGAPRRVTVEKPGYVPFVALVVDREPALRARLRRAPPDPSAWGTIVLRDAPPGNLLVNGKPIGYATPAETPLALPPGEPTLSLSRAAEPGRHRALRVKVKAGVTTEVPAADL